MSEKLKYFLPTIWCNNSFPLHRSCMKICTQHQSWLLIGRENINSLIFCSHVLWPLLRNHSTLTPTTLEVKTFEIVLSLKIIPHQDILRWNWSDFWLYFVGTVKRDAEIPSVILGKAEHLTVQHLWRRYFNLRQLFCFKDESNCFGISSICCILKLRWIFWTVAVKGSKNKRRADVRLFNFNCP